MDEAQNNQDNPELRPFLGSITGAMFANHGEQSAGCSSPEEGWVSSQVALHDMAMVGSNRHGVGIISNANLFDNWSLTAAFENMNLSSTDATADSAANAGSVASR